MEDRESLSNASQSTLDLTTTQIQGNIEDLEPLNQFINSVGQSLLQIPQDVLHKEIHTAENQKLIFQFAAELKNKIIVLSSRENSTPVFSLEINAADINTNSIAFVKRAIFNLIPGQQPSDFSQFIQIINLGYETGESNPISVNHLYVQNCFIPIFNAYKSQLENKSQAQQESYDKLLHKLNELSLSLIQSQSRKEVPEIRLEFLPQIKKYVKERQASGQEISVADFGDQRFDKKFQDQLSDCVRRWTNDIISVCQKEHDISTGNTLEEIKFWSSKEKALKVIEEQLKQPELELTLAILKDVGQQVVTISFEQESDIKNRIKSCNDCQKVVKDLPINQLLSANTLADVQKAVADILAHIRKEGNKPEVAKVYQSKRLFLLLEVVSVDFLSVVRRIFEKNRLIRIGFKDFEKQYRLLDEIIKTFQKQEKDLIISLKTNPTSFPGSSQQSSGPLSGPAGSVQGLQQECQELKKRLDEIHRIRTKHENLKENIIQIRESQAQPGAAESGQDPNANLNNLKIANQAKNIDLAFQFFQDIDVLDITQEGKAAFSRAKQQYDMKQEEVELSITQVLVDKLGRTSSAKEMVQIFEKYSNLIDLCQHVKGAVHQYQMKLLEAIMNDILAIEAKFSQRYEQTSNSQLSRLRDIPEVSGKVMWTLQLERRLESYLQKIPAILGKNWYDIPLAKQIKERGDNLKERLKCNQLIQEWGSKINDQTLDVASLPIFEIQKKQQKLQLVVNFKTDIINLCKEQRNLSRFKDVKLNASLTWISGQVKPLYPQAVVLQHLLRSYQQLQTKLATLKIQHLMAQFTNDIQEKLRKSIAYRWSLHKELKSLVEDLSELVGRLDDRVNKLVESFNSINACLVELNTCPLEHQVVRERLEKIQLIVTQFTNENYSNVNIYVEEINQKLEQVFGERLAHLMEKFLEEFRNFQSIAFDKKVFVWRAVPHELSIRDSKIVINPPIEYARYYWFREFHKVLGVICKLPKLRHDKLDQMQVAQQGPQSAAGLDYSYILEGAEVQRHLRRAYEEIDRIISEAERYASTWLSYESLYNIKLRNVVESLGTNINAWQELLNEIKQGRNTFDSSDTEKYFGAILVDYRLVQYNIRKTYNSWHRDILNSFGDTFSQKTREFYKNISQGRARLEKISFQNYNGEELIQNIMQLKQLKDRFFGWSEEIDSFRNGFMLLERNKYEYPGDWLAQEQIDSEWSSFRQMYNRRSQQFESETANLQSRIRHDEEVLLAKIKEIEETWSQKKPDSGQTAPLAALDLLNLLSQSVANVKSDYQKCSQAIELLNLQPTQSLQKLSELEEDVNGFRELWTELDRAWRFVEEIKDVQLAAIQDKKIKESTEKANQHLQDLPIKLKQYEPYKELKEKVKHYFKMNNVIMSLKIDAMKPRHWKTLQRALKIQASYEQLTLQHLWDANLIRNQKHVDDVLTVARGEMVLENMLRNIKEYWNQFEIELVRYQTKCKLIKGFDDLFQKLDEDLSNLQSTKLSPYYKTFEEEIKPWDEKLQKYRLSLDIWIDVQRRWVYLESIFFGSSDIKTQLSNEYNRFKAIDSEFTQLMRRVANKPQMVEVMQIENLQKTLERLADLLAKIQKALGDYLENQRSKFARFYFIGDEDLLEIIGNSKDAKNVQRHFTKMYAGITSLDIIPQPQGDIIKGMNSREGENVAFVQPVDISEDPSINVWLGKIDAQMRLSLATQLEQSLLEISGLKAGEDGELLKIVEKYAAQVVLLSLQVLWCDRVQLGFSQENGLAGVVEYIVRFLEVLAENVVKDVKKDLRQKFEQIITDFVHQRDVTRTLLAKGITDSGDFGWQYHMRFYFRPQEQDILKKLRIIMGNANFDYGFEYLGVGEKLVQTPLTDQCYLTLTQALHLRMGGSPFGPAGTGKTESVKALGSQLGRFVLVFNCDETFDFHAMGRIFVGLCQVGAWGCFDEFNRLEERMLSAVSQQILIIQTGLREREQEIVLMQRNVRLNPIMGVFVTMNPGYAGRSNLPENLKQLFRQMAMVKPDRDLIAQVMLFSQGFRTAERLSGKIVSLFELCNDQLSSQPHYDFGLRALKSVLVSAGHMKRAEQKNYREGVTDLTEFEQRILLRSVCETIVPKLVAEDVPLLQNLLSGVFPGAEIPKIVEEELRAAIAKICLAKNLRCSEKFLQKTLQLFQIQRLHHGVMMVGPSGSGKSRAWQVLIEALYRVDQIKGESYVIDPKAINKDELYGKLDNTTLEWTDGVFTGVLRKITENQRGEANRRHWIIFDGDVDPEWAENLNSVLDDNKLLTLPNGERIQIPPNVKIMFEVETLRFATLATVSRCGMVWFSEDVVDQEMIFYHYLERLKQDDYDKNGEDLQETTSASSEQQQQQQQQIQAKQKTPEQLLRERCVEAIQQYFFGEPSFIQQCVDLAASSKFKHVMDFTVVRVLEAMFALLRKGISNVLEYTSNQDGAHIEEDHLKRYMSRWVLFSMMWGVAGSMSLADRQRFGDQVSQFCPIDLPQKTATAVSLLDFEVRLEDGSWQAWNKRVQQVEISHEMVSQADLIVTTVDTLRHQEVLCSWLSEHRPFLLCGPPGSGKTMTLMSTLRQLQADFDMIFVNFSSSTTPSLIMKQFDHYCEYHKTSTGIILRPKQPNKWLVVFCDEINLPDQDKYNTIIIITFLRELTEQKGFWRASDRQWISLQRIQFVGACNPPTDSGRKPLSDRFLRHCPLILVDFPGKESLTQIFGTFNRAMLKRFAHLRNYAEPLTRAMIEFYTQSQLHFTADIQPHYIYSPRELTRWKHAINEALEPLQSISVEDLVRLWAHEAMRLFEDRLVKDEEKEWCERLIDQIALDCFPNLQGSCLDRPILFSNYLKQYYFSEDQQKLKDYLVARLKQFNEEELSVPLVVFDSVLDHVLRIDRVLSQPLGHLLLVGASGVGKTTLSRFVSWMKGLQVFQIKAGRRYSLADFDNDLRDVMKRSGVKNEKITFIFDESNALSPAFLEKMNALLASGDIPGLFEGEEYMSLMNQCREAAQKENRMIDSDDQLYHRFIKAVQKNLHVVFTMNPQNPDFSNRTASSPALFNRCVIDWFGDWGQDALFQVCYEFTRFTIPSPENFEKPIADEGKRHAELVRTIVHIHNTVRELNLQLQKSAKKFNYITPRDFLDFIHHFKTIYHQKQEKLSEEQLHLNSGLQKLKQTEQEVKTMSVELEQKKRELESKEVEASRKMTQIRQESDKAGEQKKEAIKLGENLKVEEVFIQESTARVKQELSEVEPKLEAARKSLSSITRGALTELKGMRNPPPRVKMTMSAVICALKNLQAEPDWAKVLQEISKDNFIASVQEFNTDSITPKVKDFVRQKYIKTADWDIDAINRASQAAGPLAVWLSSQLEYKDILSNIEPLRNSLREKIETQNKLLREKEECELKVRTCEETINQLQIEFQELIKRKQEIQTSMESVKVKVERSEKLLTNLSSERYRWDASSQSFKYQMACLIGDVLLASAFVSYAGFFDHFYRKVLANSWRAFLKTNSGINFKSDRSLIEFLSTPQERLLWQTHRLPQDDLCTENAVILGRYNRYPLIIDPSGQALEFIQSLYSDKKLIRTSFQDDSFMRNLENGLKYGQPLLVKDVEKIDPILNSVLNKEVYKAGGRIFIRVGDQEIDFSSSFQMFMITRDSQARFTPDLCSRVTFVNFTVTPSSLQNQCLNHFLKNERPEIELKRQAQMKLQGEYAVRLRELENSLLDALNNVKGSILENEAVITTLETLKNEANEVQVQMGESDKAMLEIEQVLQQYVPLAAACSKVYFVLEDMSQIHYLYEFSLSFFMDIFQSILLQDPVLGQIPKHELEKRRAAIFDLIFLRVYQKVQNSLLNRDKLIFVLRVLQIKLPKDQSASFHNLMRSCSLLETTLSQGSLLEGRLQIQQLKQLEELAGQEDFAQLLPHLSAHSTAWVDFLASEQPEECIPSGFLREGLSAVQKSILELQVLKVFRPDRFQFHVRALVAQVMGADFLREIQIDLKQVVERDTTAKSPILLCSAPGFDPSFKVELLAKDLNIKLISVALGSPEGFELAEKSIQQASRTGLWVMLKNVHLAPSWLNELEKSIHNLTPHQQFRLFLTMEFNPKVPSTLIRQSYKLVFEPPAGIRASLERAYTNLLTPSRTEKLPRERSRLHFLLAWLHAVVVERLRYTPIGYSKVYEFNEADQRCALDLIDQYIDAIAKDRSNIDPDKLPWQAIKVMLTENIYGGKIDNEYDRKILDSLVDYLFNIRAFDSSYEMFFQGQGQGGGLQQLRMPEGIKREQYLEWIENLPKNESPAWSGLPLNVEKIMNEQGTTRTLAMLLQLQDVNEEEITSIEVQQEGNKKKTGPGQEKKLQWLKDLEQRVQQYRQVLPGGLKELKRQKGSINNPLFRFLEREVTVAGRLLSLITKNLTDIEGLCQGNVISTNLTKQLAKDLHADIIPTAWTKFNPLAYPLPINQYILDYKKRFQQYDQLIQIPDYQKSGVWLGLLFYPEAFMTATRQFVAQNHSWSLEELELTAKIYSESEDTLDDDCFLINGMSIEGAQWKQDLQITSAINLPLPTLLFKWIRSEKKQILPTQIMVPVYLNKNRKNIIFSLKMDCGNIPRSVLYQKAIALIAWNE